MAMLNKKEVVARTGLSAVTIWRRIQAGDFPKPRQLTPNRVGWPEDEIKQWEDTRPVGMCRLPENLKNN
jgi:prophage regulatory protein